MPNVTSVGVTPRVCAEAPAVGSSAAATIAIPQVIADLFIVSSLAGRNYSGLARLGIHAVDHGLVFLVHELALELHCRRHLVVFRGELLLDQAELLDGLDPREVLVDPLDLRPDQILDLARATQRGEV